MKLACPSCGASIEFRHDDSFVRVCSACHSAIARTDRGIDALGRFADLAPAASGLALGDAGRWQGQPFTLAGRAEYRHPAGGSWEEWYLKLADGRWAWLSHAHGEWALTFKSAQQRLLPAFEELPPGAIVTLGGEPGVTLTAGERNLGTLAAAEGELPFLSAPGAASRFVDASDGQGRFATIDYGPADRSGEPEVYLGRRTRLEELGLARAAARERGAPELPAGAGERLACPNCGGSIELRVPERSLCVTCSYCGSLLDCEGPLAILARLGDIEPGHPALPLGAVGRFEGVHYTVTGRLRRVARYEGGFAEWEEYLLHNPEQGYRWLLDARGHFSLVTPLPAGAVRVSGQVARHAGTEFRLFDRGQAEVSGVWGEFYWKVALGESVQTADYIAPPAMLSLETSPAELHWSLGIYQHPEQVRRAFTLPALPDRRFGVGANQPFTHRRWKSVAVLLGGLLLACSVLRMFLAEDRPLFEGTFRLGEPLAGAEGSGSVSPARNTTYVFFTPSFEVQARHNVSVELGMPLSNSWAYASVDLVHEASGELRSYGTELSYYSGVSGGESWSEGSPDDAHVFAAGPSGTHLLRIEMQTPVPSRQPLRVKVTENVFPAGQLGWVLGLLAAPTALLLLFHHLFERERWSESDFAPRHVRASSDD